MVKFVICFTTTKKIARRTTVKKIGVSAGLLYPGSGGSYPGDVGELVSIFASLATTVLFLLAQSCGREVAVTEIHLGQLARETLKEPRT